MPSELLLRRLFLLGEITDNKHMFLPLGFADSIMFSKNDTDTDDSYEFSQREVSNRLMNQLIKKNTPTAGVKICDLQTRLNLLK